MANQVLGKYLEEFAVVGLLLTFLYVIIAKAISTTGLFAAVFAGLTLKNQGKNIEPKAYLVLKAAALVALIIMALIIVKVFVLTGRYVAGLSWVLLVLGAFYFATLLAKKDKKLALIASLIIIALCLGFVKNILPKRQGYNYMQEAVAWLQANNTENQPVFYEESRMRYYASAPFTAAYTDTDGLLDAYIANQSIHQYTYLLVNYSASRPERIDKLMKQLPEYREIKRFNAHKNKKATLVLKRDAKFLNRDTKFLKRDDK